MDHLGSNSTKEADFLELCLFWVLTFSFQESVINCLIGTKIEEIKSRKTNMCRANGMFLGKRVRQALEGTGLVPKPKRQKAQEWASHIAEPLRTRAWVGPRGA